MNINDYNKVTDRRCPGDRCRDEVLAMSEKWKDKKDEFIEVSGVEQSRRPMFFKYVSIAAAAVIVAGGIGGSLLLISRNGSTPMHEVELTEDGIEPASDDETPAEEDAEAEIEQKTEDTTETEETSEAEAVIDEETIDEAEETGEEDFDPKAIADELIAAEDDFIVKLYSQQFEADKSAAIQRTVVKSDEYGTFEYDHLFYPVTDPEYKTWDDVERRVFEIYGTDFGNIIIENNFCRDDAETLEYETFYIKTEDCFYVRDDFHDNEPQERVWADEMSEPKVTDDGNIIYARTRVIGDTSVRLTYTIGNTENGWRILNVDEQVIEE